MKKKVLLLVAGMLLVAAFPVHAWDEITPFGGEAPQSQCDDDYDVCFEAALKNLHSCGTMDVCNKRYVAAKQVCLEASEHCAKELAVAKK